MRDLPGDPSASETVPADSTAFLLMSTLHHMDYVHVTPLKYGLIERVAEWPKFNDPAQSPLALRELVAPEHDEILLRKVL